MKLKGSNINILVLWGIIAIILYCYKIYACVAPRICASIEETKTVIKVFVGDLANTTIQYVEKRRAFLTNIAAAIPNREITAIFGFKDCINHYDLSGLLISVYYYVL